jgi:hypothetical protein
MPLDDVGLELLLGLGAALGGANALVLLRPHTARWTGRPPPPRPGSWTKVWLLAVAGAVIAVWALATLVAR